jgi:hypothetical protein
VVVDGITRDATTEACIFDLIDNAVDAARNSLLAELSPKNRASARKQASESYFHFAIKLSLNQSGLKIADNCGGIAIEQLKTMVMRFGSLSEPSMGIGAFGLGLNRAMFKLGKMTHLTTDTGNERAELVLNIDKYIHDEDDWELPAEEVQSTGKPGTSIEIRQLDEQASKFFGDERWVKGLIRELGRRYGRFIAKKLTLSVNDVLVQNEEVQIRENSPFDTQTKLLKSEEGVIIEIECGQHLYHRFAFEPGYDRAQNRRLTAQYGWTIFCNDRAVIISDKTTKTGWDTKFHSEFYGFVGNVNFIDVDSRKLPWNTTKTDVNLNNEAYQMALRSMRAFAKEWRAFQLKRLKGKGKEDYRPIPPKPTTPQQPARPTPASAKKGKAKVAVTPPRRPDHNQFRTVLPEDINEKHCFDKQLALVREAKGLDITLFPYSGLALIRMLFETSTVIFMDRHDKYNELKQFAIDR